MGKTVLRTPLVVQQGKKIKINGAVLVFLSILPVKNLIKLSWGLLKTDSAVWNLLSVSCFLPGQGGQQVVTQIIRGQTVSTAISGASPVATVAGQGPASPTSGQTAGQTPPGTPRTQGQGQVKLSLAQLTQLTQVRRKDGICKENSRLCTRWWSKRWLTLLLFSKHWNSVKYCVTMHKICHRSSSSSRLALAWTDRLVSVGPSSLWL